MSALNILVYVALIGYVMFERVQGRPVAAPKRLFALPIIPIILAYGRATDPATGHQRTSITTTRDRGLTAPRREPGLHAANVAAAPARSAGAYS